jgi:uncharacterized membrane protein
METPRKKAFTDQEMEAEIGLMLRVGVSVSALVVLVGGALYLAGAPGKSDYRQFSATAQHLRTIPGIVHGVARLDAASVIQLGILLLIATPVARVGLCLVGFARQRSLLYVAVSALVLAILAYSLMSSGR